MTFSHLKYIAIKIRTCSGIQTPGVEKDWSKSEPQTIMTFKDSKQM